MFAFVSPRRPRVISIWGARTALFNWLMREHSGGVLVLRIEDTDPAPVIPLKRLRQFTMGSAGSGWIGTKVRKPVAIWLLIFKANGKRFIKPTSHRLPAPLGPGV